LLAARDLVTDEQREELGVGELGIDRLAVAGIERVESSSATPTGCTWRQGGRNRPGGLRRAVDQPGGLQYVCNTHPIG
jgi:hypothetical protein